VDDVFLPEHPVPMETFAKRLRRRAEELVLSNAEVARRIGLGERRYAHYVSGSREPGLATLVRIANVLQITPNDLLGIDVDSKPTKRTILRDRLIAAANSMDDRELHQTVVQAEAVTALHGK